MTHKTTEQFLTLVMGVVVLGSLMWLAMIVSDYVRELL